MHSTDKPVDWTHDLNLPPETLPPFLNITETLEMDQLPLQVALLTMEVAAQRDRIADLMEQLQCLTKT